MKITFWEASTISETVASTFDNFVCIAGRWYLLRLHYTKKLASSTSVSYAEARTLYPENNFGIQI